jgi:hypothetical protein
VYAVAGQKGDKMFGEYHQEKVKILATNRDEHPIPCQPGK